MATYYIDTRNSSGGRNGTSANPYNSFTEAPKGAHTYYVEQNSNLASITSPITWTGINTGEIKVLTYKAAGGVGGTPGTADAKPTVTNTTTVSSGSWIGPGVCWVDSANAGLTFAMPGSRNSSNPSASTNYEMLWFSNSTGLAVGKTITKGSATAYVYKFGVIPNTTEGWLVIVGRNESGASFSAGTATLSTSGSVVLKGAEERAHYWVNKRLTGVFNSVNKARAGPTNATTNTSRQNYFMPREGQIWRGLGPDSSSQCLYNGTDGSIVYSPTGNPTTTLGPILCSTYSDVELTTQSSGGGAVFVFSGKARATVSGFNFVNCSGMVALIHGTYYTDNSTMTEGLDFYGNESLRSDGITFVSPSGDKFEGIPGWSPTAAFQARGGHRNVYIHDNYFKDLPSALTHSGIGWVSMDGARIYNNVIDGCGQVTSLGGIYTAGWHVQNDDTLTAKRIQIYQNTVKGARNNNGFPGEGFGIYSERGSCRLDIHHNFLYDCATFFHSNGCYNIVSHSNYCTQPYEYSTRNSALDAGNFVFSNAELLNNCSHTVRNNINGGDHIFALINIGTNGTANYNITQNISVAIPRTVESIEQSAFITAKKNVTVTGVSYTNNIGWNHSYGFYRKSPLIANNTSYTLSDKTALLSYFPVPTAATYVANPKRNYALEMPLLTEEWDLSKTNPFGGTDPVSQTPVLTSITPASVEEGCATFTMTGTGEFFETGDVIRLNLVDYAATVSNGGKTITASIPNTAPLLATPGDYFVRIRRTAAIQSVNKPFKVTAVAVTPRVDSVTPSSVSIYTVTNTFTVTLAGANFNSGQIVYVNGASRTFRVLSAASMEVDLTAEDCSIPGILYFSIYDPVEGTTFSGDPGYFTVAPYDGPVITITSWTPTSVVANSTGVTFTAIGSGFTGDDSLRINGIDLANQTVDPNGLYIEGTIADSDLTAVGPIYFIVRRSSLIKSSAMEVQVTEALPQITSIDRAVITQGSTELDVVITGFNFAAGQVVQVDGSDRTTTIDSSTQITFTLDATDVATTGPRSVLVRNAVSGVSNEIGFTVNPTEVVLSNPGKQFFWGSLWGRGR